MADISKPLQGMGTKTQELIPYAMTGADVERVGMRIPRALRELAAGQEALGQGIASAFKSIGGAVERMGAGDSQDMARQGDIDGRSAVTRDEHGDIQVQPTSSSLFGKSGEHYASAAYSGSVSAGQHQLRSDLTRIAAENTGNPEALKTGINGYLEGHLGGLGSGQVGQTLMLDARDYGQQLITHSITQKAATDIRSAEKGVLESAKSHQSDLEALALGGASGSEPFKKALADQQRELDSLAANPAFGVSREEVEVMKKTNTSRIEDFTIQGAMASAFKTGGINAASGVASSIDARKDLSDADKSRLKFGAEATLEKLKSSNSSDITTNQSAFKGLMELQGKGMLPPLQAWQDIQKRAVFLGDPDTARAAGTEITNHHWVATASALSPSQQDRANGVGAPSSIVGRTGGPIGGSSIAANSYFTSRGWSPDHASAIIANLAGESGRKLDPLAENNSGTESGGVINPRGAFGIAQWNGERQAALVYFSNRTGGNVRSLDTQLKFVDYELRQMGITPESVKGMSGAELVGKLVREYERPKKTDAAISQRINTLRAMGGKELFIPAGGGGGAGGTSAKGVTWDDLHNNPGMAPTYIKALSGESETRSRFAETLIDSSTKSIQNNTPISQENMVQIEQLATPEARAANPQLAAKYAEYEKTVVASNIAAGGQATIDQARAEALAQPDILPRQMVDKAQEIRNKAETQLRENPVAAAVNGRWIGRPPVALDPGNPESIPVHFAGNAAVVDAISAREPGFSKSVVFKNDVGAFGAAMAGRAETGFAVLSAIASMPQDKRDATLQMPEVRAAILGMANSPDAGKKRIAFSFMDQVYRQEPQTFDSKFGADGLRQLRAWQDVEQFKSDEQIAKDANAAYDPATVRAQEALADEAEKKLKGVTAPDIAYKLAPSWGWGDKTPVSDATAQTNAVFLDDYKRAYKGQYAITADATAADKYAMEKMGNKWGPSEANGGRVMPYPPEISPAYPQINGTRNYIGAQLDDFVTRAGHAGAEAHLVADSRTESEMKGGKPPGYTVVVKGDDGRYGVLPGKFYADPGTAQAQFDEERIAGLKENKRQSTLRSILTGGQ